jgi:hypothetical protein
MKMTSDGLRIEADRLTDLPSVQQSCVAGNLMWQAADEIDRLRKKLVTIGKKVGKKNGCKTCTCG